MLAQGLSDLTPQELSTELFCTTEGERRKKLLNWINFNKKSEAILKAKGSDFNKSGTAVGKQNALIAIKEIKEIEADKKIMIEMCKEKWYPIPEVTEKEVIFEIMKKQELDQE